MADKTTFFKIDRAFFENELWLEKPFDRARAWIYIIGKANYEDSKKIFRGNVQVVKRGELMTSEVKLSEEWGWSRCKVRRFLNLLESEQMVIVKKTAYGTSITVENYDKFQGYYTADDTAEKHLKNISKTSRDTHNKNNKEELKNTQEEERVERSSRFSAPSVWEVRSYCSESGINIDAERFVSYYESNGWMVGKNKMKDWRAAVRNWASRDKPTEKPMTAIERAMAEIRAREEAERNDASGSL